MSLTINDGRRAIARARGVGILCVAALAVACAPSSTGVRPSNGGSRVPAPSTVATPTAAEVDRFGQRTLLALPGSAGGLERLECSDADRLVWTSHLTPAIWTNEGTQVRRLWSAPGGAFIGDVYVAGRWVVFVAALPGTNPYSEVVKSWSVYALDLTTSAISLLESAMSDPQTRVLPTPSVRGNVAIWDRLTGAASAQLVTADLTTHARKVVPLPSTIYPVRPFIDDAGRIVFLDHARDPNRAHEDPSIRGGPFMTYSPLTGHLTTLDVAPTANFVSVSGNNGVWWDPEREEFFLNSTDGGPRHLLGKGFAPDFLSADAFVMRQSTSADVMLALRLNTGQPVALPAAVSASAPMAFCGLSVYVLLNSGSFAAFTVPTST